MSLRFGCLGPNTSLNRHSETSQISMSYPIFPVGKRPRTLPKQIIKFQAKELRPSAEINIYFFF